MDIPGAQKDIEMEITQDGTLRWRYLTDFEQDGTTKKWTNVSANINDLIDIKLNDYQKILSADPNGFIKIDNNVIGIKFSELKTALGIPEAQEKIEMEITPAGVLQWRYLDDFDQDGETKKWTTVSVAIGDLIDGKLVNYVDNTSLATTLTNYITSTQLSEELEDYALKTYVDEELDKKQVKLTEAPNGFIAISSVEGGGEKIGIKFNSLPFHTS